VAEHAQTPTLTYDNLPTGSTLLREYDGDDGIIITAPACEPDRFVKRRLRRRAALPAAWISAGVIALTMLVFGPQAYAHRNTLPRWTSLLATACCALLFAFVWWVRYLELLQHAREWLARSTTIGVKKEKLLIVAILRVPIAREFLRESVRDVRVVRNLRKSTFGEGPPLDALQIIFNDNLSLGLMVGRDPIELNWTAKTLKEFLSRG